VASRADLWQGTGTLIAALLNVIAGDDDPLDVVAPVLRMLRRTEPALPAEIVATVGGALIAAALGESPTRWRARGREAAGSASVPALEAYAWAVTAGAALLGQLPVQVEVEVAGGPDVAPGWSHEACGTSREASRLASRSSAPARS
jgi:hypothetical protein